MIKSRQLSIYEHNQLLKYSFSEIDLLTKGNLPVEYLTGFVEFCGLELALTTDVLIPRVETEELVGHVFSFITDSAKKINYLEVGTGSGAISAAVLAKVQKLQQALLEKIVVTDLSDQALVVARKNIEHFCNPALFKKINFLLSDLLEQVQAKPFDVIVANLPYIPSSEIEKLDESVKDYEPHGALDGGESGFELIAQLLEQISSGGFLQKNGVIFLEVYETHDVSFIGQQFPNIAKLFSIEAFEDQFGRHRFLRLQNA